MKQSINVFSLLLAGSFFLTNCNDSKNTTTETIADTTQTSDTVPAEPGQTNTNPGMDLMNAMNSMMQKMKAVPMTGDFDIDFANMMIEHHQGAIDMAQVESSTGRNEQMKAKAQEIINMQKQEQQALRDFVQTYKPSGMKHAEGELQKSMSGMENKMKGHSMSGDVDKDFAAMMISHHEEGISMSKMQLANGMSEQLKKSAQKHIDESKKDISELKKLAGQ
jgi:uncharacterized protein (DUF305 family)